MDCVRKSIGGSYLLFHGIPSPIKHPCRGLLRRPSHGLVECDLRAGIECCKMQIL